MDTLYLLVLIVASPCVFSHFASLVWSLVCFLDVRVCVFELGAGGFWGANQPNGGGGGGWGGGGGGVRHLPQGFKDPKF